MIGWLSIIAPVLSLVLAVVCIAMTYGLAQAKRAADREFGDWPDQIAAREARQPDDPGAGADD